MQKRMSYVGAAGWLCESFVDVVDGVGKVLEALHEALVTLLLNLTEPLGYGVRGLIRYCGGGGGGLKGTDWISENQYKIDGR